jgi:hypothetical protein
MSKRSLVLAAIALLVSSPSIMAQRSNFNGQPGQCGFYTNSLGHQVPRPCGNWHDQAQPPGATARCGDGTYSYSEHPYASGTCSHHGGVVNRIQ